MIASILSICQFFSFYLKNDYDMVDYLNDLRDACLEAYTGIIQGLKGEDEKNISRKRNHIFMFSLCDCEKTNFEECPFIFFLLLLKNSYENIS